MTYTDKVFFVHNFTSPPLPPHPIKIEIIIINNSFFILFSSILYIVYFIKKCNKILNLLKFFYTYDSYLHMKKIMFCFACLIIWSLICVFGGYLISKKLIKPVTITKYETQWKDRVIYKDLSSMTEKEKDKELKCYYQSEFKLDINSDIQNTNKYRITGSLCERSAYKDIEIECISSGNWKLYAGFGLVTIAATAIYIGVK